MSLVITEHLKVKILSTGEEVEVAAGDIEVDQIGGDERQMGPELEYRITAVVDSQHEIIWSVWEYPLGIENHREGPEYDREQLRIISDISIDVEAD